MSGDKVIELIGITKRFGDSVANDGIDLDVRAGEIHAILGENGAGKSTLMKILFGMYQPDDGIMRLHGSPVRLRSPADAIRRGIGMVHQELMLIPELTAFENIVLGMEPTRGRVIIDRKAARVRITELSERYRLSVDFEARVGDLSIGERQRIEILKELYRQSTIMIFDEPTSSIGVTEKTELLHIVRELADAGRAVIPFITHKLPEVFEVCDRVTVLRHGRLVETFGREELSTDRLTRAMFGQIVRQQSRRGARASGAPVLRLSGVSLHRRQDRARELDDVSLEVLRGEVFGIAGVSGNGQLPLGDSVLGIRRVDGGRIWLGDEDVTDWRPGQRLALGYAHIFENRSLNSIGDFTLSDNVALSVYRHPEYSHGGWFMNYARIQELAGQIVTDFKVKCSGVESRMVSLSGGNQQKLVLGRLLATKPRLVWAHNPTKGLDVASCHAIYEVLMEQRDAGTAVVLVTEDLDELLDQCDRIAVMYNGRVLAVCRVEDASRETLARLMVGDGGSPESVAATSRVGTAGARHIAPDC